MPYGPFRRAQRPYGPFRRVRGSSAQQSRSPAAASSSGALSLPRVGLGCAAAMTQSCRSSIRQPSSRASANRRGMSWGQSAAEPMPGWARRMPGWACSVQTGCLELCAWRPAVPTAGRAAAMRVARVSRACGCLVQRAWETLSVGKFPL